MSKTGIWLTGARGNISVSIMASINLLKKGAETTGLITEKSEFKEFDFLNFKDLVIGGLDIVNQSCYSKYLELIKDRIIPYSQKQISKSYFDQIESNLSTLKSSKENSVEDVVKSLLSMINKFKEKNNLDRVIVVNLISTESSIIDISKTHSLNIEDLLNMRIGKTGYSLAYAISAIKSGSGFINFTPNHCSNINSVERLAHACKVPLAGNDGKTGETLIKTALAPMFNHRSFDVMSWISYNMLGNNDGAALKDPVAKDLKLSSKSNSIKELLSESKNLHSQVQIEYVPSLKDWKTAWNLIHFKGFLGVEMSMQFTWHGCDTALATPLIIDLIRFTSRAIDNEETGCLSYLGCFFKSPIGEKRSHDFNHQINDLYSHFNIKNK